MRQKTFDLTELIRNEIIPAMEDHHRLEVLYAVESGSRMWGFPSIDSDYDVRFIYRMRDVRDNFVIGEKKGVTDWYDPNPLIDLTGWSIEKTISLMGSGNGTVVDWLGSNIVYVADSSAQSLLTMYQQYLLQNDRIRVRFMHHHRSLARSAWAAAHNPDGTLSSKKVLYAIRSAMIYQWCEQRRDLAYSWGNIPISFSEKSAFKDHVSYDEVSSIILAKYPVAEKKASVNKEDIPKIAATIEAVSGGRPSFPLGGPDINTMGTAVLRALIVR